MNTLQAITGAVQFGIYDESYQAAQISAMHYQRLHHEYYISLLLKLGEDGILYSLRNPTEDMPIWALDYHHEALNRLRAAAATGDQTMV